MNREGENIYKQEGIIIERETEEILVYTWCTHCLIIIWKKLLLLSCAGICNVQIIVITIRGFRCYIYSNINIDEEFGQKPWKALSFIIMYTAVQRRAELSFSLTNGAPLFLAILFIYLEGFKMRWRYYTCFLEQPKIYIKKISDLKK